MSQEAVEDRILNEAGWDAAGALSAARKMTGDPLAQAVLASAILARMSAIEEMELIMELIGDGAES